MFNECAKEYATQHLKRDYEAMKPAVNRFMEVCSRYFSIKESDLYVQTWLQRKTDVLLNQTTNCYSIELLGFTSSCSTFGYFIDSIQTTHSRLFQSTSPLLTIPENIERGYLKCSDNHDQIIIYRLTVSYISIFCPPSFLSVFSLRKNLVDDPNILSILSQHSSIDIITSKSSFHLLLELFSSSSCSSPLTLPITIREFQYETLDNPNEMTKKKVIFIDKSFRRKVYTKRELNEKFYQRSFRSLLLSTTGGKREMTDNAFNYTTFNQKTDFQITEIKTKVSNQSVNEEIAEKREDDNSKTEPGGYFLCLSSLFIRCFFFF